MRLPSLWRTLQAVNTRLFSVFEEFYEVLLEHQRPVMVATTRYASAGSGTYAYLDLSIAYIDTHNELNSRTFTWNPSKLGFYRYTVRVELNGTIPAGDDVSIVMYEQGFGVPGTPKRLSHEPTFTGRYGVLQASGVLMVQRHGLSYRFAVKTTSTGVVNLLGPSNIDPLQTSVSMEYIGGFQ